MMMLAEILNVYLQGHAEKFSDQFAFNKNSLIKYKNIYIMRKSHCPECIPFNFHFSLCLENFPGAKGYVEG